MDRYFFRNVDQFKKVKYHIPLEEIAIDASLPLLEGAELLDGGDFENGAMGDFGGADYDGDGGDDGGDY